MCHNSYSPHSNTLTIVKSLRDGEIEASSALGNGDMSASVETLRSRDKLTAGLRSALKAGIPIEELSASTGLSPEQIHARLVRPTYLDE